MSRYGAVVFGVLMLVLCAAPRRAAGQVSATPTPLPTPSPTGTASPVSPQAILLRSFEVGMRLGSYHSVTRVIDRGPGKERDFTLSVDDVTRQPSVQHEFRKEVRTGPHHKAVISYQESISAGHLSAWRHPGVAWDCVDLNKTFTKLSKHIHQGVIAESVSIVRLKPASASAFHNLGPTTVDGVPVWHIRVMGAIRRPNGEPIRGTGFSDDDFISRTDYTMRRSVSRTIFNEVGAVDAVTMRVDYSHYGYPYQISLPKACAVFRGVFDPMGPPPKQLLRQAIRGIDRNSVHIDSREAITHQGKTRLIVILHIDQRSPRRWVDVIMETRRTRLTTPRRTVSTARDEQISVGRHSVERTGNGPWRCLLAVSSVETFESVSSAADHIRVAGQAYVDDAPTWRVHIRISGKPGVSHTEDDYISVKGHRLIRAVDRSIDRSTSPPTREFSQSDYSRYGVPIHITLPPCRD